LDHLIVTGCGYYSFREAEGWEERRPRVDVVSPSLASRTSSARSLERAVLISIALPVTLMA
jgi:hypothetical protein